MPFGLVNCGMIFLESRFMNDNFADILDKYVIYLDDILVCSKNPSLHITHVRNVLQKLRETKFVKLQKCVFHLTQWTTCNGLPAIRNI